MTGGWLPFKATPSKHANAHVWILALGESGNPVDSRPNSSLRPGRPKDGTDRADAESDTTEDKATEEAAADA